MNIGKRIKALRKKTGMKLIELSEKSGIALATLSRIEHEKMTGTLDAHLSIAKALGITLSELYEDIELENQKVTLLEEKAHSDVFVHNDKASYEMLTMGVLKKKMMPIMIKIEPEGQTNIEQTAVGIEKFIYVLEGNLNVVIGPKSQSLSPGDTLYFEAHLPHYFKNEGELLAKAILVSTPPVL
jgi:transcriptional regulator with XRE-family HTH domain